MFLRHWQGEIDLNFVGGNRIIILEELTKADIGGTD